MIVSTTAHISALPLNQTLRGIVLKPFPFYAVQTSHSAKIRHLFGRPESSRVEFLFDRAFAIVMPFARGGDSHAHSYESYISFPPCTLTLVGANATRRRWVVLFGGCH